MEEAKPSILKRHEDLLNERYDLSNKPSKTINMTRVKPVQERVRVKLTSSVTWNMLATMTPEDIKKLLPAGFFPVSPLPATIFLTTRPDLADVSHRQLVTINNYFQLFNSILNPKQLEGLRWLSP